MSEYRLEAQNLVLAQSQVPNRKCGLCFLISAPEIPPWVCVFRVAQVEGVSRRRKAENTIPKSTIGITLACDRMSTKIKSTVVTSEIRSKWGLRFITVSLST